MRRIAVWWGADAPADLHRLRGGHPRWARLFPDHWTTAALSRGGGWVRRKLRDNGLGLVFGLLFLAALIGQAIAGHADFNNQQITTGGEPKSFLQFIASSDFVVDV